MRNAQQFLNWHTGYNAKTICRKCCQNYFLRISGGRVYEILCKGANWFSILQPNLWRKILKTSVSSEATSLRRKNIQLVNYRLHYISKLAALDMQEAVDLLKIACWKHILVQFAYHSMEFPETLCRLFHKDSKLWKCKSSRIYERHSPNGFLMMQQVQKCDWKLILLTWLYGVCLADKRMYLSSR